MPLKVELDIPSSGDAFKLKELIGFVTVMYRL